MMMFSDFIKKKFKKSIVSMLNKYGRSLSYEEKENLIRRTLKFYSFVINVGMFIFLMYFFSTMIYDRIGFDKTVIVLLTIIVLSNKDFFK